MLNRNNAIVLLLIALWLGTWAVDNDHITLPWVSTKIDRVTYVFEKDLGGVPAPVSYSLRKLNEAGIIATELEVEPQNGLGQIPTQDKLAVEAAGSVLPCLVVQSGDTVVKVAKSPTTIQHVSEATGIVIEEPK